MHKWMKSLFCHMQGPVCLYSWLHVFYSPFYMPGGGSLLIESEIEKNKEREGQNMKMEQAEEGGLEIQGSEVL